MIAAATTSTIGGKVLGVFKNIGGTLSVVGQSTTSYEDFSGIPQFVFDVSGTTIRLRVTGQAVTNITWYGKLVYVYMDTVA